MSLILHDADNGFKIVHIDDDDDETVLGEWVFEIREPIADEKNQYTAIRRVIEKVVEIFGPDSKTHTITTELIELVRKRGNNGTTKTD